MRLLNTSITREDASSSTHLFSTCFHCALQRIFSVALVRCICPSIFLQLDIAYLFSAPGWSMFYALGLAKTPPWLQCDSPALCLPQSTLPLWSPLLSSSVLPHLTSSVVLPPLTSPTAPPRVALPATLPHTASLGVLLGLMSSVTPPFPVPSVVPIPCQECYQKSVLFAQFLLIFITYESLSYSICLHCANFHTPLPFLFYLYDFQNIKTRHPDLFGAVLGKGHL